MVTKRPINKMKCKHGYYVDPNGYHIFPKIEKRDIWKEVGRLYNKEFPETKQERQNAKSKPVNEVKAFDAMLNLDNY